MKIIFIDSDFKCHATNDDTMIAVETDFFDNKCDALIEGYRFVPYGYTWIREDGVEFRGKMIAPWKPYEELAAAQTDWDLKNLERLRQDLAISKAENADMKAALAMLGVTEDMEVETDV